MGRSDQRRLIRGVEAFERDLVQVLNRPNVAAHFWVELDAAQRLVTELRTEHREVTLTTLLVKATAMAVLAVPDLHRMYGWMRAVQPGAADVGVSVEGEHMLAPVHVVERANERSLPDLARDIRAGAKEQREQEARRMGRFGLLTRLAPFAFLRRLVMRVVLSSPSVRRRLGGTIQFSSLQRFAVDFAYVPQVLDVLVIAGGLENRTRLDADGAVTVATGANFVLHASHTKLNGVTGGKFIERFRQLLAEPAQLL